MPAMVTSPAVDKGSRSTIMVPSKAMVICSTLHSESAVVFHQSVE